MMLHWIQLQPGAQPDMILGFIPTFLDEDDPRGAVEQFATNYIGGFNDMPGFTLNHDYSLSYPGDPELVPMFATLLHDKEKVFVYLYGWVCVVQEDKSFKVARLD